MNRKSSARQAARASRASMPPQEARFHRSRVRFGGAPAWSFFAFLVVAVAFLLARPENRYPAAPAAALVFFLAQCLLPGCRPEASRPLCPWNWALFVFFLQLDLLPLSLLEFGPLPGVLPALPSGFAINLAILIDIAAFVCFAGVYHFHRRRSRERRQGRVPWKLASTRSLPSPAYITMNAAIGIVGFFFAFGSIAGLQQYFSDPSAYVSAATVSGKLAVGAGLFLRPFLGFALVMAWCRWLDGSSQRGVKRWSGIVTLLAIAAVCLANATFHYNRGALLVPLVAILAVILHRRQRFPRRALAFAGVALLAVIALMPFYGAYRSSDFTLQELATEPSARGFLAEKIDLPQTFQVYGGAPQFLGYFLEEDRWGTRPQWGRVVLSSVLSPVPILGKPFRQASGNAIYNRLIYGASDVADQIAPFTGELFLDFHLAGVLAGFCLLGWVASRLQRAFENSRTSVEIFVWQYFAIWIFFLIFGSVSVVSQIFLYFGWPLYLYLVTSQWHGSRARGRVPDSAPTVAGAFSEVAEVGR